MYISSSIQSALSINNRVLSNSQTEQVLTIILAISYLMRLIEFLYSKLFRETSTMWYITIAYICETLQISLFLIYIWTLPCIGWYNGNGIYMYIYMYIYTYIQIYIFIYFITLFFKDIIISWHPKDILKAEIRLYFNSFKQC